MRWTFFCYRISRLVVSTGIDLGECYFKCHNFTPCSKREFSKKQSTWIFRGQLYESSTFKCSLLVWASVSTVNIEWVTGLSVCRNSVCIWRIVREWKQLKQKKKNKKFLQTWSRKCAALQETLKSEERGEEIKNCSHLVFDVAYNMYTCENIPKPLCSTYATECVIVEKEVWLDIFYRDIFLFGNKNYVIIAYFIKKIL